MMRKYHVFFFIFLIVFININTIAEENNQLNLPHFPMMKFDDIEYMYIGKNISEYNIFARNVYMVVASGDIYPYFILRSNNYSYKIVFSNDNIVKAIFVNNDYNTLNKYYTPENVFIGMNHNDFLELVQNVKLLKISGWGYCGVLPSGWKIVFFCGKTGTDYYPTNQDMIGAIYKD